MNKPDTIAEAWIKTIGTLLENERRACAISKGHDNRIAAGNDVVHYGDDF
jgi:hypothetical protein